MDYYQQLLNLATELWNKPSPNQADLRRAVSTAYYALFHLLISEAVANWRFEDSRNGLSRMFEHHVMAKASNQLRDTKRFPFVGEDPKVVEKLRLVATRFSQLQEQRHLADYDNSITWTQTDVGQEIFRTSRAIDAWKYIKHEKIAQNYLVSLMIKPRN
ncbi:MAG: hypothetical protein ABI824_11565 [Acidobacteriota bacterium]